MTPLHLAEILFLGDENPLASTALTYYSSGHSTNKTTWKDDKCRTPLNLISAYSSTILSSPRFLAEEARPNIATHLSFQDKTVKLP